MKGKNAPNNKVNHTILRKKKILFGHQSVGMNIMKGMKALTSGNPLPIIMEWDINKPQLNDPGFYHTRLGSNFDPASKIIAFSKLIHDLKKNQPDIAFFKFCYVDIKDHTKVTEVAEKYAETMTDLEKSFPEIRFMHFTVPLRSHRKGLKVMVKKLLNVPEPNYLENIKRQEYNDLIREKYSERGYLFDIAGLESQDKNKSREKHDYKGKRFETMRQEYTSDGGHLNTEGSKYIANELIHFLENKLK